MNVSLLLFLLFIPAAVQSAYVGQGDDEPNIQSEIEFSIKGTEKNWISQKIVATLKVKTTAYSIQNLRVDKQHNDDVIIIEPSSAAYKGSEKDENDISWQYNAYEYYLYPVRAGEIIVEPFVVEFSASLGYGMPEQTFHLQTQPVHISVGSPEGIANNQFVLSTPSFSLDVSYTPDIDELKVGEAFERTVTMTASDVPDVLLQPLPQKIPLSADPHGTEPAIKIYRHEPVLSEIENKQQFIATRVEYDTFIATAAAENTVITLPEIKMYWWHPDDKRLYTETIVEKSIKIAENPLLNKESIGTVVQSHPLELLKQNLRWFFFTCLFLLLLFFWLLPAWFRRYKKKKAIFEKSINGHFKHFQRVCSKGGNVDIYKAFYAWAKLAMPEVIPLNFKQISRRYPALKGSLLSLEIALIKKEEQFDVDAFYLIISHIHNHLKIQKRYSAANELIAALNPVRQ